MVLVEKAILVVLTLDAVAAIAVPLVYRQSLRRRPPGAPRPSPGARPSDAAEGPRADDPASVRRAGRR
jgi:hypothetical protein